MRIIKLPLVLAAAAAVWATPAAAKGPFNLVTVAGPDWHGEIEIRLGDSAGSSQRMGMLSFMHEQPVSPPAGLGRGYLITRGYEYSGQRQMYDRLVYFPGSPGYVYYLEAIDGPGPMDGDWYRVTEAGAAAFREAMEAEGMRLPEPRPSVSVAGWQKNSQAPLDPTTRDSSTRPAFAGPAVGILAGAAAGWAMRGARGKSRQAG